jgi:hypothetical protein
MCACVVKTFADKPTHDEEMTRRVLKCVSETKPTETNRVIKTIREKPSCRFDKNKIEKVLELNNKQVFADYVNDRNIDLCNMDKNKYVNANDDLVLYPEFKWSVPLKRPPVCYTKGNYYQPLIDQTALIGTLLTDANTTQVGSILPNFDYKEKCRPL